MSDDAFPPDDIQRQNQSDYEDLHESPLSPKPGVLDIKTDEWPEGIPTRATEHVFDNYPYQMWGFAVMDLIKKLRMDIADILPQADAYEWALGEMQMALNRARRAEWIMAKASEHDPVFRAHLAHFAKEYDVTQS